MTYMRIYEEEVREFKCSKTKKYETFDTSKVKEGLMMSINVKNEIQVVHILTNLEFNQPKSCL